MSCRRYDDGEIHAETVTLPYAGFRVSIPLCVLDKIYHGSIATFRCGAARRRPRRIPYRLYCEVNYEVFTDGILPARVAEDAVTL